MRDLLARRPAQLSGGQQQRVALARAIVRNPTVYLMDEPLSNLDAQLRLQTRTELKRLHRELGTTMIYVTHDQSEAMTLGGRIAIMQRGVDRADRRAARSVSPAGQHVRRHVSRQPADEPDRGHRATERDVTIGVRAEDVVVTASPADGSDEARVLVVEPMGSETLVTLEYRGQRLVARVAGDARFEPGQAVVGSSAAGSHPHVRRRRHTHRLVRTRNQIGIGFGVQGSGFKVRSWFRVQGSRFGFGFGRT